MNASRIIISVFIILLALSFAPAVSYAAKLHTGSPAPDFTYTDINGNKGNLSDFKGKYVVIEWFNHGCPFVAKHYNSKKMQELQEKYTDKGVIWISVNSTSSGHKDYRDEDQSMKEAQSFGADSTHIVIDGQGDIGKLYSAKTTPHIFIVDPEGVLIYQGAADDIKSTDTADIARATNYIDLAMTEALSKKEISTPETKPYGCSVKY